MKTAKLGVVSEGTLITAELLDNFREELDTLIRRNGEPLPQFDRLLADAKAIMEKWDSEEAGDILGQLFEALSEFAPSYAYFGAAEGDGACFGFWPDIDAINELPHVEDSDGAIALGEDCRFVNDHGNVTVYAADGSVIFDLV